MNAIPFDTLHFANRLKAVGFTDEQAEAITELQRAATDSTLEQARHDYHLDDVATKRDMKELETTLKHEVELLRADTGRMIAETNQRIYESKADLTRWIVGAGFLQTTLIIGVLLKITHLI
ncbi:MAG: DUF1640 domain-containing protein [Methylococcaceae bacterium]|nr:DUF1640 domain-containing protein [Methylococcaceae bacterium]